MTKTNGSKADQESRPEFEHKPGDPPHRLTRTRYLTPEEAEIYRAKWKAAEAGDETGHEAG